MNIEGPSYITALSAKHLALNPQTPQTATLNPILRNRPERSDVTGCHLWISRCQSDENPFEYMLQLTTKPT